jgi:hypothetical protein
MIQTLFTKIISMLIFIFFDSQLLNYIALMTDE